MTDTFIKSKRRTQSRILLLFVIFGGLLMAGCSKEYILSKRLEGKWKVIIYQKTVYAQGMPVLDQSNSVDSAGTFEFFDSGKGKYIILKNLGEGTYTGNGDFTWTNTADILSIKINNLTEKFQVITNTKSKIELLSEDTDFSFSGSTPGVLYSMEERILLRK
jgi:hypothetical protein